MRRSRTPFLAIFALWACWSAASPANAAANLLADHSFENNDGSWILTGPANDQSATWAASDGATGIWFRGFDPGTAQLSQSVVAPTAGEYMLLFDSRVEDNFPTVASSFGVNFSGTSGSAAQDLFATATPTYKPFVLSLPSVAAGETLTVSATATHSGGTGPQLSAFVDNFYLGKAANLHNTPFFDGERHDFDSPTTLLNNWGGGFNGGTTDGIVVQSAVKRSGDAAYRVNLGPTASGQTKFFQTFATELKTLERRNTRDLAYFDAFETYVRNDTGADLTFTIELKDYRDSTSYAATKSFILPSGATWNKVATSLNLSDGWNVTGSPQLDQTYAVSFLVKPNGQTASGSIYLDDARLIEPGSAVNPLTAPIRDIAEVLAKRTFHGLWGQRSRQTGIVPNASTDADLGALNTTSGLVWALPSAVRRGWVSQTSADAYMSRLSDTLNHNLDQTNNLPSRFLDLATGDAFPEESTIDAAFLALGLQLYKNQPGLDPALTNKIDQTVNRFDFASFAFSNGWGFGYDPTNDVSGLRYKGYTTEGKTISLAAELSTAHHVDLEQLWHSDDFRTLDYLINPDLEALVYANTEHRAPFSLALINLFLDVSDRGIDNYPIADLRGNPWGNFKDYEADSAQFLAEIGRPNFFQPDAAQGGPPSNYKAYSLYNLYPSGSETNEDLFMPWSASLALLSGIPEAGAALRYLLQQDLHGPLGLPDGTRWDTAAAEPTAVNALQDNWNLSLSLMALMRYLDGTDSGARFLADLPQVSGALDNLFFDGIPGDFDLDGDVDARDLELWQQAYGTGDLSADANSDRVVNGADFLIWQRQFAFGLSLLGESTAVPEPHAVALLLAPMLMAASIRTHRLWSEQATQCNTEN